MGSLQVAQIRGIPIKIHVSLWLTAGLLVLQWGPLGLPASLLLFGSVLLHELGHAVVAQRLGVVIDGIHLHLLGGVALMKSAPKRPSDELFIAAAGPLVSVALAVMFGIAAWATGATLSVSHMAPIDLLAYGALLNAAMALFNLIPALPMDGGRIFRALLVRRCGPVRATRYAARVSRVFGAAFVLTALVWGIWSLGLIGVLLLFMSRHEERAVEIQEQLRVQDNLQKVLPYEPPFRPIVFPSLTPASTVFIDRYGRRIRIVRGR
ncbi:MAG: M50 family metallopeptidase [Myxococcota bacterium]